MPGNTSINVHDEMNEFGFGLNDFVIDDLQGGVSMVPTESFAYGSSSLAHLSQNSAGYETLIAEESKKIEKGDDLWNLVQSTMDTIKTDEQKNKC